MRALRDGCTPVSPAGSGMQENVDSSQESIADQSSAGDAGDGDRIAAWAYRPQRLLVRSISGNAFSGSISTFVILGDVGTRSVARRSPRSHTSTGISRRS